MRKIALTGILSFLSLVSLAQTNQPNILWLVCEDQSPYFSFYGDSTAQTPELDQLASKGIVFENVYATSPVCSPARSAIITGMHPISMGTMHMRAWNGWSKDSINPQTGLPWYSAVLPKGVRCFTEYLRESGYYCTNNNKEDYNFKTPQLAWDESSPTAHWRNRTGDQPFFAVFNFNICHESGIWKQSNKEITVNANQITLPSYYPQDSIIRRDFAINYSNLERMDSKIGEILDQLKEDGLMDNTYIFFYSDHGGPFPRQKRSIYNSGLKVPMIMVPPKNESKKHISRHQLISFVDFAPSILDLAGIQIPKYMQGQTIFDDNYPDFLIAASDRFDEQYDRKRALITKDYKFIQNYMPEVPYNLDIGYRKNIPSMNRLVALDSLGKAGNYFHKWLNDGKPEFEFYNLSSDPNELHNLATESSMTSKMEEYKSKLHKWLKQHGDYGNITEESLIKMFLPNGKVQELDSPKIKRKRDLLKIKTKPNVSIGWRYVGKASWNLYTKPVIVDPSGIEIIVEKIGFQSKIIILNPPYPVTPSTRKK